MDDKIKNKPFHTNDLIICCQDFHKKLSQPSAFTFKINFIRTTREDI